MAADLDTPTLDSTYVNVVQDIRDSDNAVALMFNGVSATNIPVGAVQFAGGAFGIWNGSSFPVQAVVIGGGGTGATTAAEARTNLSLSSVAEANALYMKVLSNGSDINDVSIFRTNIDVYSTSQVYTQTEVDTIVAFSSQAQAEAGTNATTYMNPLRTSQAIQAIGRTPVTVWTGSDTSISDAEILASSGFSVISGTYFITTSSGVYQVPVSNTGLTAFGTSNSDSDISDNITIITSKRQSGSFTVIKRPQGIAPTFETITEIKFTPL